MATVAHTHITLSYHIHGRHWHEPNTGWDGWLARNLGSQFHALFLLCNSRTSLTFTYGYDARIETLGPSAGGIIELRLSKISSQVHSGPTTGPDCMRYQPHFNFKQAVILSQSGGMQLDNWTTHPGSKALTC